jgi:hypothetical protein
MRRTKKRHVDTTSKDRKDLLDRLRFDETFGRQMAEIICQYGNEPQEKCKALLVLMDEIRNSEDPNELISAARLCAFMRHSEISSQGFIGEQVKAFRNEFIEKWEGRL